MKAEWIRAYRPAGGRWLVIVWEAFGLAYLHWAAARYFDLWGSASWLLATLFALAWAVGSWQIVHMGLYVGTGALRIRGILRTRTVPWTEIETVLVEDVIHRAGPWRIPAGRSAVLLLRNGDRLNTTMWEQGMDFHRRPRVFRSTCQDLRHRVHSAKALI